MCKALYDVNFSQILRNGRNFRNLELSNSVICKEKKVSLARLLRLLEIRVYCMDQTKTNSVVGGYIHSGVGRLNRQKCMFFKPSHQLSPHNVIYFFKSKEYFF